MELANQVQSLTKSVTFKIHPNFRLLCQAECSREHEGGHSGTFYPLFTDNLPRQDPWHHKPHGSRKTKVRLYILQAVGENSGISTRQVSLACTFITLEVRST